MGIAKSAPETALLESLLCKVEWQLRFAVKHAWLVAAASPLNICTGNQGPVGAQAQTEVQASRAREAAYQSALQELTLFKSRTAAALLQACCTSTSAGTVDTSMYPSSATLDQCRHSVQKMQHMHALTVIVGLADHASPYIVPPGRLSAGCH